MNGVPIARILGFEVRLHISWLFIVAIITVTVAERLTDFQSQVTAPLSVGDRARRLGRVHAHGGRPRARPTRSSPGATASEGNVVVVHFIGSPAAVDVIASTPRMEAAIAIAGPLTSALIGAGLFIVGYAPVHPRSGLGARSPTCFAIIGALDLVLAGVSVVPAFPLDGGRIVRAAAWARTGNQRSGTRIAGSVGRWTGRAFLVIGLVLILTEDTFDGIMIGLVGWFLMASARSVDRWLVLDDLVQGIRVDEAMEKDLETLSPQLTLDTFATSILDGTVGPALPVVRDDVARRDRRGRPGPGRAPAQLADDAVRGRDGRRRRTCRRRAPTTRLTDALERLRSSHLDGLPVLDGTDPSRRAHPSLDRRPAPRPGRGAAGQAL